MVKFSQKLFESNNLPSNDDIDDYFLSLLDERFEIKYVDAYINGRYVTENAEEFNNSTRYCKVVHIDFNYDSEEIGMNAELFQRLNRSNSHVSTIGKIESEKFVKAINQIISTISRLKIDYQVYFGMSKAIIFLIGNKISGNEKKDLKSLSAEYDILQEKLIKLYQNYKQKVTVTRYGGHGLIHINSESPTHIRKTLGSLSKDQAIISNEGKDRKFYELADEYEKNGYKISAVFDKWSYRDAKVKLIKIK